MSLHARRVPSPDDRRQLIAVALGNLPADIVVVGGTVVDTTTRELRRADIAIRNTWIAAVGDVQATIGTNTEIIDATDMIVCPGLIDAHFHIEGSMVTVRELAAVLLPRGVTTLTCDPHEIGNVLGADGMELLIAEAAGYPLKVFLRVPAELPGSPDLETTGGRLDDETIRRLLDRPDAVSLAGDCSPTWLLEANTSHLSRIDHALQLGLTINGQEPDLAPEALNAFVAAGPQDTHIAGSAETLLQELRLGLHAIINNMPFQFPDPELTQIGVLVTANNLDPRHILLCADDVHPNLLLRDGGVDAALRRAIRCGVPPAVAVQMATNNVAEHYHLECFGTIAPGRVADLCIVDALDTFNPEVVIADGQVVARSGTLTVELEHRPYPQWAKHTVKLAPTFTAEQFIIADPSDSTEGTRVEARAIYPGSAHDGRLLPGTAKQERRIMAHVHDGALVAAPGQDVALAAVIDRHARSGRIGRSFVQGFGITAGAFASTVNHDNHSLMVIGTNADDMAIAVNRVIDIDGGIAIVCNGRVLGDLALPVAGLLSEEPIAVVAQRLDELEAILVEQIGISPLLTQPLMLLQMFALVNVPALGLSDHGLVDVYAQRILPATA